MGLAVQPVDVYDISEKITKISKLFALPKLRHGSWQAWVKAIQNIICLTSSAATFLAYDTAKATITLRVWEAW